MLTVPATFSITSASVGLLAALLALGMSSAPGRRDLRWFGFCAALAALFNLSNVGVTLHVPLETALVLSRLNLLFGGLHAACWFKYTAVREKRGLTRLETAVVGGGVLLSVASLVPRLVLQDRLFAREVPWLGVTYADAPPTAFGELAYVYHAAALLLLIVHYLRRRAAGDREVSAQLFALSAVVVAVAHDELASIGFIRDPYVLELAIFSMILAVGGSLTKSFVVNARALEVSSRSLALAHEQLVKRERLAALGELAAVVAHEVRNPLAVVFNATAGLRKASPSSKDHDALLAIVQEEAEHLRDIVSDLLEFARPRPPLFAEVALDEIVRTAIDAARAEAGVLPAEVLVEVTTDDVVAVCDERLVRQAVINLVANALTAPGRRGPVRVVIAAGDDGREESILVHVIDDGQGISPDLRDRVFTPFYTTRPSGTGLGLAVVRSSAEAHGGDVVVSGTPGGGATFTLRLPRRRVGSS